MSKRQYISTAHFNAPFEGAQFIHGLGRYNTKQGVFGPGGHGGGIFQTTVSGLGAAPSFPKGRSYLSTAHFRAPYDSFGYFQDNNLMGIDSTKVVLRQIPTWVYAVGGGLLLLGAYKSFNKAKKTLK